MPKKRKKPRPRESTSGAALNIAKIVFWLLFAFTMFYFWIFIFPTLINLDISDLQIPTS